MVWDLMGAAVLITLGVLFLLASWTHVAFHNTWPLLLIVIGIMLYLRSSGSTAGHIPPGAPAAGTSAAAGAPETKDQSS